MAKAIFHRNQRVYVEPVGTWAVIDKVNPVWVKGFDEPVKVTYDCGLGRDFAETELTPESDSDRNERENGMVNWRLMRARNKWQTPEESRNHPFPGTYPIVVTDENDWGGWRVPGAEYERDPALIEMQARLIASAPHLLKLVKDLRDYARKLAALIPGSRKQKAFSEEEIRKIAQTYHNWRGTQWGEGEYADVPGYCKSASLADIEQHGFALTPGRYVGATDVEDDDEGFEAQMAKLTGELSALLARGSELEAGIKVSMDRVGYAV